MSKKVDRTNKEEVVITELSKAEKRKLKAQKTLSLLVGLFISFMLYFKMLECVECNKIVIIYFAIIGLCCFMNVGLPIDKAINAYNN